MARRKTTVYVDEELLRAAKVEAALSGRSDADVREAALRRYLGLDVLDRVWARNAADPLTADEALAIAYEELGESRAESTAR